MENGECREPRGIVKNAQCILVMMSAKQQPLGRIFSMHSPLIGMALTGLSHILWKNVYSNWEAHNQAKHSADQHTQEATQSEITQQETQELYALCHKVLPYNQDIFYPTLNAHFAAELLAREQQQLLNT